MNATLEQARDEFNRRRQEARDLFQRDLAWIRLTEKTMSPAERQSAREHLANRLKDIMRAAPAK